MNDLRYALRSLAKSPGFTLVSVCSLAIGIGAATAIFSLLNAVMLRAVPVRAPHELRLINWIGLKPEFNSYTGSDVNFGGGFRLGSAFPYPAYREFRDRSKGLASAFAFFPLRRVTAMTRSEAVTTDGLMVSGNFFSGYGASTVIGRPLTPEDDQPGAASVVVITYRFWERQFGLDPQVLGQTVSLNQNAFTIVGVLPRDFVGPQLGDPADFYVPFAAQPALVPNSPLNSPRRWWLQIMARIVPENSAENRSEKQIQAELTVLFRQVLAVSNMKMEQPGIVLQDGAQGAERMQRKELALPLLALLGVVGLVIAIACANVAGLSLARGATRQHEFAIRAAIGAGRWRLVRQSLMESLVLGVGAAGVGLLLAEWIKTILLRSFGVLGDLLHFDLRTDRTVLLFAIGASVLTALVFGLLPALRASRVDPLDGLKSRGAFNAPRLRIGKVLVALQVALSVLLVVGAGLMIRTFVNLVRIDPGFNAENVLLFRIDPRKAGYKNEALAAFYDEARRVLSNIPGTRSVALSSLALISDGSESTGIDLPGAAAKGKDAPSPKLLVVSDGFFATMGIPLLLGRDFTASDTAGSAPVAVVNETFARTYFPDENPLGRTFVLDDGRGRTFTVVGVARDAKYSSLRQPVPPVMYYSFRQHDRGAMVFAIRSTLPPLSLVPAARQAILAMNPNLPLSAVRTQEQLVENSTALDRLFAGLCSGLAGLALLLACLGLYGLMAYNVTRRTAEFGVRVALGATARDIAWPLLREALILSGAGLAIGLPAALGVAVIARHQLYGVSPADPVSLGVGASLLIGVVLLAAWLPARRATRVDPMIALRAE